MTLKRCSRCKQGKPLSEFHKCRRLPSGLRPECKECTASDAKKRKLANPDHIKAMAHKSHRKHSEANNTKSAKRYRRNLERNQEKRRQWRIANPKYAHSYHKI